MTLTLDPDDLEAMRKEALRRAQARKSARSDVSELVRDAIRAWLAKQRSKP